MTVLAVCVFAAFFFSTALCILLIVRQDKEIRRLEEEYDRAVEEGFDSYFLGVNEGIKCFAMRLKIMTVNPLDNYEDQVVKVSDIDKLTIVVKEEQKQ